MALTLKSRILLPFISIKLGYFDLESILIKMAVPFFESMILFVKVTFVMFPLTYIPFPEAILMKLFSTTVFDAEVENSKPCSPVMFWIKLPYAEQLSAI